MKLKINFIPLVLWVFSFEIISYSIGFLARRDKDWYNSLVQSDITPSPSILVSIIGIMESCNLSSKSLYVSGV